MYALLDRLASRTIAPVGPPPTPAGSWQQTPYAVRGDGRPGVLGLTDRELDVAELVVSGFSYAQIARTLFVSQSTVGYHLSNIYGKCGVRGRHELIDLVRSATVEAERIAS